MHQLTEILALLMVLGIGAQWLAWRFQAIAGNKQTEWRRIFARLQGAAAGA